MLLFGCASRSFFCLLLFIDRWLNSFWYKPGTGYLRMAREREARAMKRKSEIKNDNVDKILFYSGAKKNRDREKDQCSWFLFFIVLYYMHLCLIKRKYTEAFYATLWLRRLSTKQRHNTITFFFSLVVKCCRYCWNIPLSFSLNYLLAVVTTFNYVTTVSIQKKCPLVGCSTNDVHLYSFTCFLCNFWCYHRVFLLFLYVYTHLCDMQCLWDNISSNNGWTNIPDAKIIGHKAKLSI